MLLEYKIKLRFETIKKIAHKQIMFFILFLILFPINHSFSQSLNAEQIYKKVSGAVVVIQAYNADSNLVKQGSGVVISSKGYVVTNYHVFEGCDKIEVLHNGKVVPNVEISSIDTTKDILILKVDKKEFPALQIGDEDKILIGERVYAIGSPLGFENTISEGIVSGLRKDETTGINYIQITASISPGSSGGAVVNGKGQLIGISTFYFAAGQNVNFAIPINEILKAESDSVPKDISEDLELFNKAVKSAKQGNYALALSYYTTYLTKHPSDAEAYNKRGNVRLDLGDFQGAIQDYNKAIELRPNYAPFYCNRANAKDNLKEYQGAIQDCTRAITINPNDEHAFVNRGFIKEDSGDYYGAIRDYNKAIAINPNNALIYYDKGLAESNLKDYQAAIEDYSKAILISPDYESAYVNRANVKNILGDYQDAFQDLNKAILLDPNDEVAYINRGQVKYNLEDYQGAIQDYNKAIELNPTDFFPFRERGLMKYILGDKNSAYSDLTEASMLGDTQAYEIINKLGLR